MYMELYIYLPLTKLPWLFYYSYNDDFVSLDFGSLFSIEFRQKKGRTNERTNTCFNVKLC